MVQTSINSIKNFFKNNRTEFILLCLVLLVAAFVRLWRIGEYMTFLGDEGRDVIIVRRFLTEGDIFLIGPGTSIGNMYLGPMYYYMMALPLLLFFFSPIGPAIGIAILGIITVWFVWYVIREWFPSAGSGNARVHYSALAASLLYALAPTVIIYSRSSWNPNIMPFFALLCVYSLWKIINFKSLKWFFVLGFSFAAVLQSHYLGLILIPLLGVMWLLGLFLHKNNFKKYLLFSALGFFVWAILMSPLVIFDARHGWRNFDAIKTFFTVRQTTVNLKPWKAIPDMWPLFQEITGRVIAGRNIEIGNWTALGFILSLLWLFKEFKNIKIKKILAFGILVFWIGIGMVGFGLYKQHIYDHYFGFLFPAYFVLLGGIFHTISTKHKIRGSWIVLTIFFVLLAYNLVDNPLRYSPNKQLQRSVEVANKISNEANGEKFNLAVIAERNYEAAYEYFLLKDSSAKIVDIDPQNTDETITEQLFVVCELPEEECDPTHNSKAEVANFGWSEIEEKWNVGGVVLYKLIHVEQ